MYVMYVLMQSIFFCVFRSGRFTVRREHNSKLIVTMPAGVQISENTDGKSNLQIVPTVMQVRQDWEEGYW